MVRVVVNGRTLTPVEISADILRAQPMAGRQDHLAEADVFADLDHVLPDGDRPQHLDLGLADALGVFDHDDGVRIRRDHAAGVDECALAFVQRHGRGPAHRHLAGDVEIGRQAGRGAVGVARSHGVAIHRGPREARQIVGGAQGLRQHTAQGIDNVQALGSDDGSKGRLESAPGFRGGLDLEQLGHEGDTTLKRLFECTWT